MPNPQIPLPADNSPDYWTQLLTLSDAIASPTAGIAVKFMARTLESETVLALEAAARSLAAASAVQYQSAASTLEAVASWQRVNDALRAELGALLTRPLSEVNATSRVLIQSAIQDLQASAQSFAQAQVTGLVAESAEFIAKNLNAAFYAGYLIFKLKGDPSTYDVGKASLYALAGVGVGIAAAAFALPLAATAVAVVAAGLAAGAAWKYFAESVGLEEKTAPPFWDQANSPSELVKIVFDIANGLTRESQFESRRAALRVVYEMLSPGIAADDFLRIVDAAGIKRNTDSEEERMLNAIQKLVLGDAGVTSASTVESFLTAAYLLPRAISTNYGSTLQAVSLVNKSAPQVAALAQSDAGYRYALRELIPFTITGIDYSRFNANGELDLYNPSTDKGLTDRWLESRAKFLDTLIRYNTADGNLSPADIGGYYEDQRLGIKFGSSQGTVSRHVFGADSAATPLIGFNGDDFLFGGLAGDIITANGGNDYIEGGAGNDTINAGGALTKSLAKPETIRSTVARITTSSTVARTETSSMAGPETTSSTATRRRIRRIRPSSGLTTSTVVTVTTRFTVEVGTI